MPAYSREEIAVRALDMRSISFAYGSDGDGWLQVFSQFSMCIGHDEWVGVIGPSGCGKSTLVKLVTGIHVPDEGAISVLGMDPRVVRKTHQLGVAFQGPSLVPWFTVRRNIELPAIGLDAPALVYEATRALADAFKIRDRLEALPAELSGGMAVRVSLARALIHNPNFVVLDEPFASLDEITAIEITRYLLRWRGSNPCSLLLISHDLEAVARLADRCLCFPANGEDDFTEVDLKAFGRPPERSPEIVAQIRLGLLEKYL